MQQSRFDAVISAIDAANAEDPRIVSVEGRETPSELLYSERMSARLAALYPDASETLKIAARAQHIRRWTLPRDAYPHTKAGYHAWRTACRIMHADTVGRMMADHGYDQAAIDQVGKLIRKQDLKSDPDSQRLQNIVGVVFVEHYFAAFAEEHSDEKLIGILRKTARKLDAEGIAAIGALDLPPRLSSLIAEAVG